ncbi:hypothetical protein [Streptomyces qinglanensis]|uniref:Uncharacterized protein n=1 Tax=Streptomyces qinglanensis TaxID=943816 RepID=A0A1H9R564_9ACTN|nr:hypothetical protein [Streptomyces qinglanensis]SER67747.1 hypothetical protein SAMN05421870_103314 [Streptomyces qinglanensis]
MHKRALALGMLTAGAALLGTATAAQAAMADSGSQPPAAAAPAGGGAGKLGLGTLISQPEQQLRTLGEQAQRYGQR